MCLTFNRKCAKINDKSGASAPLFDFVRISDFCAERNKAELCKLEALLAKGDTQNSYAPDNSHEYKSERHFPAEEDYPDNICYRVG